MNVKVVSKASSWFGHVGELVREEGGKAVVRFAAGSRLVEFEPEHVAPDVQASEPEPAKAEPEGESESK